MNSVVAQVPAEHPGGATQKAISFHYDVSNAFYSLWLDREMLYSSAKWEGDEDLETAQMRKVDWHLEHAGAAAGQALLDVGCGWGATLRRAIERYGVRRAVGLTLADRQADWVRTQNTRGVEVHLQSWRDHRAERPYDGIVSVGAFEHFADLRQTQEQKIAGYREFFEFCHRSLRPGGRLSLQTMTYENSGREQFSPFFAEQVFPESDLPRIHEIACASDRLFEIEVLLNERSHYARTMRAWLTRLRATRWRAVELVGEEKVAVFERYLALMVVAFHTGSMNLARIGFRRIDSPV
jgi:cyclopropane-fatty-acyl-phospholipid synthase